MAGTSEAAVKSSVLESVTFRTEENRTAITFLFNEPTKMVFYTIGNPPQIVADIVGNAFAQPNNIPTEISVNAAEIDNITPFIDPSLGDAHFYGIDFLVIHLKDKVAYTQVKHKKGYTLYVANSPALTVSDIKPHFKKAAKEEKAVKPEEILTASEPEVDVIEIKEAQPITENDNIETQAIAAAINIEPKTSEWEPEEEAEFKPIKYKSKHEKTFIAESDNSGSFDTNITCGKDYDGIEDEIVIKEEKPEPKKSKKKEKKVRENETDTISKPIKEEKKAGIELEPRNVAIETPTSQAEKIQLAMQWRQVGYNHQKSKDYDKALSAYNKAVELHPNYACFHNDVGIIYFHLGIYDKAITEFQKAIELDDEYLASYSNMATVYEQIGDNQKAIEYWQKRVAVSKSNDVWTQKAKKKIEELKKK
jgi:hypothetical protein